MPFRIILRWFSPPDWPTLTGAKIYTVQQSPHFPLIKCLLQCLLIKRVAYPKNAPLAVILNFQSGRKLSGFIVINLCSILESFNGLVHIAFALGAKTSEKCVLHTNKIFGRKFVCTPKNNLSKITWKNIGHFPTCKVSVRFCESRSRYNQKHENYRKIKTHLHNLL